ncbi:MAG: ABC transporter permease [Deltaproteobacteria bacterium]|nr:ABC transporter permease [Deltaproteobacteria bacterium]
MKALDRKLLRDLVHLRGQGIATSLLVGCGIASYLASVSTYRSLQRSRDAYYTQARFADVFAHVVRAPEPVLARLRELPGVAAAEARVTDVFRLEVPGAVAPARAQFVSVEDGSALDALHLRKGRFPERDDEVLVSELFAQANGLEPGSSLEAVVKGKRVSLRVVGIALSPEFVWIIPAGGLWANDKRFGVVWVPRRALARSMGMEGAFNDVVVALAPGANRAEVIDAVDRVLEPYGSFGAVGRDRQPSGRLVDQELAQLRTTATLLPAIFMGVAVFLLNVLLARIIGTHREQIAALKALGYANLRIGLHYVELALVLVAAGAAVGLGLGAWTGARFIQLYAQYFRFPVLAYRLDADVVLEALAIAAASGLLGAARGVLRATRLAPAEAMRPESPAVYRRSAVERAGLDRLLPTSARMVLRTLERHPIRAALSALAIGLATAILVVGRMTFDSVDWMLAIQFERIQREDVAVRFEGPLADRARLELENLPGVRAAEPERVVPVRIRAGHHARETALVGVPEGGTLRQLLGPDQRPLVLPESGVALSRVLAELLQVRPGDGVELEELEGARRRFQAPVTGVVDDQLGTAVYARMGEVARLLRQPRLDSGALLAVDGERIGEVVQRLERYPRVVDVERKDLADEQVRRQTTDLFVTYQLVLSAFAAVIAAGVVFNNARIALAVRSRDLATLRILGFTRGEVAAVLVGEQAIQLLIGVPLGLPLGRLIGALLFAHMDRELYRFQVVVTPETLALSALTVVGVGAASALLVRRQADRMDLVAVLKARD